MVFFGEKQEVSSILAALAAFEHGRQYSFIQAKMSPDITSRYVIALSSRHTGVTSPILALFPP